MPRKERFYDAGAFWDVLVPFAFVLAAGLALTACPPPAAGDERPVTIDVLPRVLLENQAIRLRCRVPRADENRSLEWGVEGYRTSVEQLDPGHRITHEWIIEEVPCDSGPAFCRLKRQGQKDAYVQQRLEIRGCRNEDSEFLNVE